MNDWIKNVRDMRDWGTKHRAENPDHVVWVQPHRHEVECFTCGENANPMQPPEWVKR